MAMGDVADRRGEEVRMFGGGKVAAWKLEDLGSGHALAGRLDLAVLVIVRVLVAAAHIEGDRAVEFAGNGGAVPPLRVALGARRRSWRHDA